jgi:hypothetical protein
VKCLDIICIYAPCLYLGQKRIKEINGLIHTGGKIGPGIGLFHSKLEDADSSSISGEVWLKSKAR